jgi:MiaB/RimO family radical SAM methylthiotransferase
VKISRGKLRSQPVEWVIERVKEGVEKGFRDISLIGTNVSGYGQDIGTNLPNLLKKLFEIDPDFRIELRNAEPEEVMRLLPEFTEVLKTGRITYLEYPLQSGSDRILKLMRRGYTVEDFTRCLLEMKKAAPKLFIRTQVMVGFPTETDEDFQKSLEIVKKLPFGYVEAFFFSPRPGTKAAELDGRIDRKVMKQRYKSLQKVIMRQHVPQKLKLFFSFLLKTITHPGYFKKSPYNT